MTLTAAQLVGTWALISYQLEFTDGSFADPFGDAPIGRLHYGEDRFMAAHIMAPDRPPLGDTVSASAEAARKALAEHFSYCGRYSTRGNRVTHSVEISVSPDWVGQDMERFARIEGDILTLSAPETSFGPKRGVAVLTWQRLTSQTNSN
ncbi:lipocalin-like domain-containing protein [Aliiroseovarius sp. KMU-50]|uniref:Lipocalin-like domain-containing protein n=1 Tax=Aliiroseovarius salicola TaxID=3009082 RepID=A0ABT4VZY0_9RHOB|nr:lipocalin-like domain-containing protein [Aliiroseovarius sp. KMU-50]MDA5093825.1 lipocalin-like domain-containing protein [Aliiroseovarius sp. KMU-50]